MPTTFLLSLHLTVSDLYPRHSSILGTYAAGGEPYR
jgi:hypothetical protein